MLTWYEIISNISLLHGTPSPTTTTNTTTRLLILTTYGVITRTFETSDTFMQVNVTCCNARRSLKNEFKRP